MFRERLNAVDRTLFDHVEAQLTLSDRISLLALHASIADRLGEFVYLEIGSFKGGSLQALVADERCRKIVSIDKRVEWQRDDARAQTGVGYPQNSTQEMLDLLASVPGADMTKLETIELGTDQIDPTALPRADFCFIDGEHTHDAALRDGRFCRQALGERGFVAFHDYPIVGRAILRFLRETREARGYLLADDVFVVEVGVPTLLSDARVSGRLRGRLLSWRLLNSVRAVPLALGIYRRSREWLR
ncbi:MAG TPA: class I SAM-dependent methyltransferase [Gaiellaceae bacterium]|nr:class I SAM-dependent methyltransferase [Gaiellaceae bacterium]